MNKINFRLFCLVFACVIFSGCASTVGSKNTQFTSQPKLSNKPARSIVICRPSAFYHALNSMGVTVNSAPSFDLGSGERYLLATPARDTSIEFHIPNGDYSRYGGTIKMNVPNNSDTVYILVGNNKGGDQAVAEGIIGSIGMVFITTTWRAQIMDRVAFEKSCGVENSKQQFITDKSLI